MELTTELWEKNHYLLYSIAWNILNNVQEAEDAVQDTFVNYYRVLNCTLAGEKYMLLQILRNICIDKLRKRKTWNRIYDSYEKHIGITHELYDKALIDEMVEVGMKELTERRKEVFIMHYYLTLKFNVISNIFNIKNYNARRLYKEARDTVIASMLKQKTTL